MLAKKEFFIIDDNPQYNVVFHTPSMKLFKVGKDVDKEMVQDENFYERFNDLKDCKPPRKIREYGKGRVQVTFMASRTCNLGCRYCFAGEGEYGCVETKPKHMTNESYFKSIKKVISMYPEGIKSINFFGGEPLLNLPEIKKFVPEFIKFCKENKIEVPYMAISTNGTIINEEIVDFMKENNLKVAFSLDGIKYYNDFARVYKNSHRSVYDDVTQNIKILKENGLDVVLQMTINRNHLKDYKKGDMTRWLDELEVLNNVNVALVPVVSNDLLLGVNDKDSLEKLDILFREATNYYINELFKDNPTKYATGLIAPLVQIAKKRYANNCSAGHSVFVDTDGNLYPCQMYCNDEEYILGNVDTDKVEVDKIHSIANMDRANSKECHECICNSTCSTWCKGLQTLINKDPYTLFDCRCVTERAVTEECIKVLSSLEPGTDRYKLFWDNVKNVGDIYKELKGGRR